MGGLSQARRNANEGMLLIGAQQRTAFIRVAVTTRVVRGLPSLQERCVPQRHSRSYRSAALRIAMRCMAQCLTTIVESERILIAKKTLQLSI